MAFETTRDLADSIDLSSIVETIRKASNRELKAIQEIADILKKGGNGSTSNHNSENSSPNRVRSTHKNNAGSNNRNNTGESKTQNSEISSPNKAVEGRLSEILTMSQKAEKSRQRQSTSEKRAVKSSGLTVSKAKHQADPFSKFWKDEKGRLRRPDGKYASKGEQKDFANSKQAKQDANQEKTVTLLDGLLNATKKTAGIMNGTLYASQDMASSTTGEAAGAATGGPMFYAAKEIFDASKELSEQAKSKAESISEWSSKRKETKAEKKALKLQKEQVKLAKKADKNNANQHGVAGSALAKENAYKRDNLEVLREQSAEDEQFHKELLRQLDGLKLTMLKAGDDDGGIVDGLEDVVGTLIGGAGAAGMLKWLKDKLPGGKDKPKAPVDKNKGKPKENVKKKPNTGKEVKSNKLKDKLSPPKTSQLTSVEEAANGIKTNKPLSNTYKTGKVGLLDKLGNYVGKGKGALTKLGDLARNVGRDIPWLNGILSAGIKAYDLKDRDDLSNSQKGAQIASVASGAIAGGAAGSSIGTGIGAAIGTIIAPGIGTAIGGKLGFVAGGFLGTLAGENVGDMLGEQLSDYLGSDKTIPDLFNDAADTTKDAIKDGADYLKSVVNGFSNMFGRGDVFQGSYSDPKAFNSNDVIERRINQYDPIIKEASAKYGVPEAMIRSIIRQESGGKANAKSGVGAAGLMQLMPGTAREVGVTNRYDPRQSIMGGTKYFAKQLKRFNGDAQSALAAYNAGGGNVSKAQKVAGSTDPAAMLAALPMVTKHHAKETQGYVKNIMGYYSYRTNAKPKSLEPAAIKGEALNVSKINQALVQGRSIQSYNRVAPAIPVKTNQSAREVANQYVADKATSSQKTSKPQSMVPDKKMSQSLRPQVKVNPANQQETISTDFDSSYLKALSWDIN